MWTLKNKVKINKVNRNKHRYGEKIDGFQIKGRLWDWVNKVNERN